MADPLDGPSAGVPCRSRVIRGLCHVLRGPSACLSAVSFVAFPSFTPAAQPSEQTPPPARRAHRTWGLCASVTEPRLPARGGHRTVACARQEAAGVARRGLCCSRPRPRRQNQAQRKSLQAGPSGQSAVRSPGAGRKRTVLVPAVGRAEPCEGRVPDGGGCSRRGGTADAAVLALRGRPGVKVAGRWRRGSQKCPRATGRRTEARATSRQPESAVGAPGAGSPLPGCPEA